MKKVLIIEDNDQIREALVATLKKYLQNCTILAAGNGEEGLCVLNDITIDLILTDLQMPIKDGYEVIEHRNKHHPHVHVIVMTANNTFEVRSRLNALGVSQLIQKPFDFEKVSGSIREKLFGGPNSGMI